MIEAAIFDMDGLLVDSEPIWQEVAIEIFETVGVNLTIEMCQEGTGLGTADFVKLFYERFPWEGKSQEQVGQEIIERGHERIATETLPMPGAHDTVRFFHERGIPLAVASASPMEIIETVLRRLDLVQYFTLWHSAVLETRSKPHPDVYWSTIEKLKVKGPHCVAFEDSGNGLRSAHAAGMLTVAVPAPYEYDQPKFDIADIKIPTLTHFNEDIFNNLVQKLPL
ncbi:hexitol phosphatase HxpB [Telluribacter sp. SYSU D00476]|uniref:hexitol phosphatase HxpB n=1 Tax=Telluribacter sp. SYSU D00476 TaxID=2811430 RepID=UPI001FF4B155|nr:hexitol phosphatase HxpB [Telluribacter sp. SYSU D00476]